MSQREAGWYRVQVENGAKGPSWFPVYCDGEGYTLCGHNLAEEDVLQVGARINLPDERPEAGADPDSLINHLEWLRGELLVLRDFGLGFALCLREFSETREAIKVEQARITTLIEAEPD